MHGPRTQAQAKTGKLVPKYLKNVQSKIKAEVKQDIFSF